MEHFRPTLALIDRAALADNFRALQAVAGTEVLAIVKANAYGHGAITAAKTLEPLGVAYFGVALVEEGIELRNAGISRPIVVLSPTFAGAEAACVQHRLQPVVGTFEALEAFAALGSKTPVDIHLELDTGIHRQGFIKSEWPALFARLRELKTLHIAGVQSHFASADTIGAAQNAAQLALFREALAASGLHDVRIHMANSAATLGYAEARFSLVRSGLALYGYSPFRAAGAGGDPPGAPALKPVLRWTTRVAAIHTLPPGASISYGATFTTTRDSRIATLPVGYADGYPRQLSNRAHVLVGGRRCPVVGRVCMDIVMCDVSDVSEARIGDEVVLIGAQGHERLGADELAGWCDTIAYEILTGISSRVPRLDR